jgi:transglutaminase-like putative cysteine protease
MARTWLTVLTAAGLVVVSVALMLTRWAVLGADVDGPRGASTWKVTLVAAGELTRTDASVVLALPPDFRGQHIFDERFASAELTAPAERARSTGRREAVWRRAHPGGPQPFRLTYSFRCLTGMRRPSAVMAEATRELDGPPPRDGSLLKPAPRIESTAQEVFDKAQELVTPEMTPLDQVRALFNAVDRELDTEPSFGTRTALECLRAGRGDAGGKSRLLVALCRNRGIPARVVCGLILGGAQQQRAHYWAEAWVGNRWLPMCPTGHHFDVRDFPGSYLVLHLGDEEPVRCAGGKVDYGFIVEPLPAPFGGGAADPPSALKQVWLQLSLHTLNPAEQQVVKFLLLLALGALVVSFARTVVGVPTFGTFGPALLGLAFLDLTVLPWALGVFLFIVLVGWGMRRVLDRYRLLMVPRTAALLTLIITLLIAVILVAHQAGVMATQYIALFPLVILTHLVERFWTVEAEDGTAASFKTLLGTLTVSAGVSLLLSIGSVARWMFRYPESLGLVLAAQLILGRYTGYRLSELYRFRDLMDEGEPSGGTG